MAKKLHVDDLEPGTKERLIEMINEVILWANFNLWFNTDFVEKMRNEIGTKGTFTLKQLQGLSNIREMIQRVERQKKNCDKRIRKFTCDECDEIYPSSDLITCHSCNTLLCPPCFEDHELSMENDDE